jgi:hypothetical protein
MPSAQIPVADYVRKVPADLRPTLQAARKTIKAIAPKATETAWRTWPIRYRQGDRYVVAVGNYPRWISIPRTGRALGRASDQGVTRVAIRYPCHTLYPTRA